MYLPESGEKFYLMCEPDEEHTLNEPEASTLGFREGSLALDLHVNFKACEYMQSIPPIQRARHVQHLMLQDMLLLAEQTAKGTYEHWGSQGFRGISPLAYPLTLRALGATVVPVESTALTKRQWRIIDGHAMITTGEPFPHRRLHAFGITNRALVAAIPTLKARIERVESRL